jgi:hypothetical protein
MPRHLEPQQMPPTVAQNHEHKQALKWFGDMPPLLPLLRCTVKKFVRLLGGVVSHESVERSQAAGEGYEHTAFAAWFM